MLCSPFSADDRQIIHRHAMVLADARRKEWKVRGREEEGRDAREIVQKVYKDKLQRIRAGLGRMGI